jgi:hypothetical protein
LSGRAQGVQHLTLTQPGGMPGMPVMTGIQKTTNGVQLTWDGPSGYYQVWHKIHLTDSSWLAVGPQTNLSRTATITNVQDNDFFRVFGPSPSYAGAMACAPCHGNIYPPVTNTPHASAFTDPVFMTLGGQTNPSCLACHTVGYGLPTGFVSASPDAIAGRGSMRKLPWPGRQSHVGQYGRSDGCSAEWNWPRRFAAAVTAPGSPRRKWSLIIRPLFLEDWSASPHAPWCPTCCSPWRLPRPISAVAVGAIPVRPGSP